MLANMLAAALSVCVQDEPRRMYDDRGIFNGLTGSDLPASAAARLLLELLKNLLLSHDAQNAQEP